MPKILHLETSGKNCSVAISKGTEILATVEEMTEQFSHSKKLHTFIQWALEGAEISLNDLDAVSISKGPGSYTGLRIGTSAAKGLAFGLDIPLISTQSLRSLMNPYFQEDADIFIATLKARKNELFYQVFENNQTQSDPQHAIISSEIFKPLSGQKVLIVGNGAPMIESFLKENHPDMLPNFQWVEDEKISAQNAIDEGVKKFKNQELEDVAYFEPQYIKSVHITQKKATK